jgi:tetratricopeptide (TPR) repeat protein
MIKKNTLIILSSLFLLVSFCVDVVIAQKTTKSPPKRKIAAKTHIDNSKETERFSNFEFVKTATQLPPNFIGNNALKIFEALENSNKSQEKGEFETQKQYVDRISRERRMPLMGNISKDSILAFAVDVNAIDRVITNRYDADEQMMNYEFTPDPCQDKLTSSKLDSKDSKRCFNLEMKIVRDRNYNATNGFGSKFIVNEKIVFVPSLLIEKWNTSELRKSSIRLTIEKAKEAKHQNSVLMIGKLTSPFISKGFLNTKPTQTNPKDWNWLYRYLHLELQEIWIFNQRTGEIYKKINVIDIISQKVNEKAFDIKQKAIQEAHDRKTSEEKLADATSLFETGKTEESLSELREILNAEPMNANARELVGKIQLRNGDIDSAVIQFKTALFWDNRLFESHLLLGKIFLEKKDCFSARNYLTSASELNRSSQEVIDLLKRLEVCGR